MGKKIDYSATEQAQLTSEGKDSDLSRLQANGARALPSSPSASGWSADAIKRQLYRPSEIIFAWLLRLASAQLALAKSVDDSLDGETKRLDLDIAGLRDLIDDIAQHGIAKFDDDYNVIKDTYVKKAQIVNNVTSEGETEKPLGAGQGYVLQNQIDHILTLLASDDTTLDELQEIVTYIKNNKNLIDGITTNKVNVSDIIDNLTSEIANKPLSANQGKVLKGLIDALQTVVNGKLDKSTSSEAKVYGVSNGNQTMWGVGQGANGSKLVQRTSAGQVNVPETPTANEHATSKKYVDEGLSSKATKTELDEVKDELDSASVDVIDYSMAKVSGKDDGLALPEESQLELKALRGNTVAWNQLVNELTSSNWFATNSTATYNDGIVTMTATATDGQVACTGIHCPAGHKCFVSAKIKLSTATDAIRFGARSGEQAVPSSTSWQTISFIYSSQPNASGDIFVRLRDTRSADWDAIQMTSVVLIDLTQLYGAGNEPTAVTDEKAQWAINYALKHPANDAGSLVSVDMSAYETEGFNQWDEEWEAYQNTIRSKNYSRCLPNTDYYCRSSKTDGGSNNRYYVKVAFYDENKTLISSGYYNRMVFTTPQNARFFKIETNPATVVYGNVYLNDVCINVSDPSLNGTYKPYEKNSYPISFHGKSAGNAYDERKADGTDIVRIGDVDLTTLDWTYRGNDFGVGVFSATISNAKAGTTNALSSLYQITTSSVSSMANMSFRFGSDNTLYVKNTSYSDAAAFKSAMSGVYLYYELATPVQSVNDPLPNAIKVYQDGTEWQINDGAPCGMEKNYDISIKDQVLTNVRVDARQEEEIKELKETALTAENVEGVKLWENGNPSVDFGGTTITTANISDFKYIVVSCYFNSANYDDTANVYLKFDKSLNKKMFLSLFNQIRGQSATRTIQWTSNTSATISDATMNETSGGEANGFVIPVAIYGIK